MPTTYGCASRQRGMGMLGFVVLIGLAAFFFTLLFKLGPLYMQYLTIKSVMDDIVEQSAELKGGVRGIADSLDRRLMVNEVRTVRYRDFDIKKIDGKTYDVSIDYERRVHLFFNVDAVVTFHNQVEVQLP